MTLEICYRIINTATKQLITDKIFESRNEAGIWMNGEYGSSADLPWATQRVMARYVPGRHNHSGEYEFVRLSRDNEHEGKDGYRTARA